MKETQSVEVEGKVVAVLPSTMFHVELENKHQVLAHIAGRLRKNFIKITLGDTVKMKMDPSDVDKGCIVYRLQNVRKNTHRPIHSYGPRRKRK